MFKSVSSLLLLLLAVGTFATREGRDYPVPLGGQCGTIAGTKPCATGLKCCYLHPDDGVCLAVCP
ncbi:hypothetical protein L218DRAFT_1000781 [Marasmius fiardii PR-910]|nr:hypothetical protein L218DRAFT_1000781 [Marasmius fiardii PR-910]